ncbi:hypothetical protein FRACYDRAFT_244462 [Fragilariopsis cylindrus CCMP1102]|uniref:Uncharacterized protein n=1 Tax=Fragilariopsis cylindrus CCMP1102 TaxID=635003 RepID=A0A1E7F256_9STRA|nr:hypothetical protein FRACYDRAFT_244462 [Fragilariopsis cylindrus CCMP1102]|eukprot:OEU12204.1 hypothetical protein FRACYDRAFT_244462 [Fragilariopsis cylindrus CCMP1102]
MRFLFPISTLSLPVLSLSLLLYCSIVVDAFVSLKSPAPGTAAGTTRTTKAASKSRSRLYYDIQRDPQPSDNVWAILSNTEKWISQTLADAQKGKKENPLSRKEVSYVCETSKDPAMILANIFRKVKEARQLGESHGQDQEELIDEKGEEKHQRSTLRQTQVVVIPANEELIQDFKVFDALIEAINQARRNARDYVTDHSLERLDEQLYGDAGDDRDWVVSVNCAHLHPKYGYKTPEQELKDLKEEGDNDGDIDLNLQEYKKQRIIARRSPYPSVVIEVLAMAPPTYTAPSPTGPVSPKSIDGTNIEGKIAGGKDNDMKIDAEFVNQLEALFSRSSLDDKSNKDGDFYESIGSHIETFSAVTPLMVAQNWIDTNDPLFNATKCAFTVSDATYVDEGYEFVFTNLGMQTSQFIVGDVQAGAQKRQYLVMSHFLSSSATSLEKFTIQAGKMIRTLPLVGDKVDVSCLHPEHVDKDKRCPVPVIILQWKE